METVMDKPSLEAKGKTVLILEDGFSLESVEDKIVALGYIFQRNYSVGLCSCGMTGRSAKVAA